MELAKALYIIDVLYNLSNILVILFIGIFFIGLIGATVCKKQHIKKILLTVFISELLIAVILIFIPEKKTMYVMLGVIEEQKLINNHKVQEISGKVFNIIF